MIAGIRHWAARLLMGLLALAIVGAPVGAMAAPCAVKADPCAACPMHQDHAPGDAGHDGKAAPVIKSCGCAGLLKAVSEPAALVPPQRAISFLAPDVLHIEPGLAPETEPRPPRSF
jgi:hypothetical protein